MRRSGWSDLSTAEGESLIRIYEDSFPPTERNPVSRFQSADLEFWLALDRTDELIGFCAVGHLPRCAYLQYLAVSRPMRDRGVGAALLARLAADLSSDNGRGIVLEVEDPAASDDSPTAERRLQFYERWGAYPLTDLVGYYIPDRVEPEAAVPMMLLWRSGTIEAAPPRGDALRTLLRDLHTFEYAEFAPAGYLARILAAVTS
jgi:ribosomal protein S18 acetylase RimI-like enzyme